MVSLFISFFSFGGFAFLGGPFLISEGDENVAGWTADRTGGAFGTGLETLQRGTDSDHSFLDRQRFGIHLEIVMSIGHRSFQRFANQLGRFFRSEIKNIHGAACRHALNFAGDIARLFGRETNVF